MKTKRLLAVISAAALLSGVTACSTPGISASPAKLITYVPTGEALDVQVNSSVELDDQGCLWVKSGQDVRMLAAFPQGTQVLQDKIEVPSIGMIPYGAGFSYTGSEISVSEAKKRGIGIPSECGENSSLWLVLPLTHG